MGLEVRLEKEVRLGSITRPDRKSPSQRSPRHHESNIVSRYEDEIVFAPRRFPLNLLFSPTVLELLRVVVVEKAMITRSKLAEQLREYQIKSKHDWASVSLFSSSSNFSSSSSRLESCARLQLIIWTMVLCNSIGIVKKNKKKRRQKAKKKQTSSWIYQKEKYISVTKCSN